MGLLSTSKTTWLPQVVAGTVMGVLNIIQAVSYGALLFNGPLSEYLPYGIGSALLTGLIVGLIVLFTTGYKNAIAAPQLRIAPILGLIALSAYHAVEGSPETAAATAIVSVAMTTLVIGIGFAFLGAMKLGNFVRYIPYPVVGGFLAGSGWLLFGGALNFMLREDVGFGNANRLLLPEKLMVWLPGVAFGVLLFAVLRRWRHFALLPSLLAGGFLLFYAVNWGLGLSLDDARQLGLLIDPGPGKGGWSPLVWGALGQADFGAVAGQASGIATAFLVGSLSLLLTVGSVELLARHELDTNRSLLGNGAANLVSSLSGGSVGTLSLSQTALSIKMQGAGPIAAIVAAGLCGVPLLWGTSWLSYFPTALLGGMLVFQGISFLSEWLWDARKQLPKGDYALIVIILFIVAAFGYLQGVAAGLLAATVLFIVNYSRLGVVRHSLSGANHQSNVDRSGAQRKFLKERGKQVQILKLQGFLFFGTAQTIVDHVKEKMMSSEGLLKFLILDFRRVDGIDSSAVLGLQKLAQLGQTAGFEVVISESIGEADHQLTRAGLIDMPNVSRFADLDHALEWCEDRLLTADDSLDVSVIRSFEIEFEEWIEDSELRAKLLAYFERLELQPGDVIIRQGENASDLFFIESGKVTVQLDLPDGSKFRLRTMGAGTVVGEIGLYLKQQRSASVVTDVKTVAYRLPAESLQRMERDDPSLASPFHAWMARLLADRLTLTNDTLHALLY